MKPTELAAPPALASDSVDDRLAWALKSVSHLWRLALERMRGAALERRAIAQLHAMSDRQLADIGLRRTELPSVLGRDSFPLVFDHADAWSVTFRAKHLGPDTD